MRRNIIIACILLGLAYPSFAQQNNVTPAETEASLKKIEELTTEIRGLPFKNAVTYKTMAKKDLVDYLSKKFHEEATAEEMRNTSRAMSLMGLLPDGYNLEKEMLDLLGEQVGAFYDPESHALYTFSDMEIGAIFQKVLLAHELTHALQDQHFDLGKFPEMKIKDNDDRQRAFQSLIEGDATVIMPKALMKSMSNPLAMLPELMKAMNMKQDKLEAAPPYLRDQLTFPYTYGEKFATALFNSTNDFSVINKAYKDLPTSTEQVLHPEKYLDPAKRDNPKPVTLKKLGGNWTLLHDNVMGEFSIRALFATYLNPPAPANPKPKGMMEKLSNPMQTTPIPAEAVAASEGWGGDRYHVYGFKTTKENAGTEALGIWWSTVWDTEEDALEFADLMSQVYQKRYADLTMKESSGPNGKTLMMQNANWNISMTRKGDKVTIIQSTPAQFGEFSTNVEKAK